MLRPRARRLEVVHPSRRNPDPSEVFGIIEQALRAHYAKVVGGDFTDTIPMRTATGDCIIAAAAAPHPCMVLR
jgi:hypothetical protein